MSVNEIISYTTSTLVIMHLMNFTQFDYIRNIDRSLPSDLCKPPYHEFPKTDFPENSSPEDLCAGDSTNGWEKLSPGSSSDKKKKSKPPKVSKINTTEISLLNALGEKHKEFRKIKEKEKKDSETSSALNNKNGKSLWPMETYGYPYKHMFATKEKECTPPFKTICASCNGPFDFKWLLAWYLSWFMESAAYSFAYMRGILKWMFKKINKNIHNDESLIKDKKYSMMGAAPFKSSFSNFTSSIRHIMWLVMFYGFLLLLRPVLLSLVPLLGTLFVALGGIFSLSYGWILGIPFFFTGTSIFWGTIVSMIQTVMLNVYLTFYFIFPGLNKTKQHFKSLKNKSKKEKTILNLTQARNLFVALTVQCVLKLSAGEECSSQTEQYIQIACGSLFIISSTLQYLIVKNLSSKKKEE